MTARYTITQENTTPEFVTLQQAKDHLKIGHTYEDNLIAVLVEAAITAAEDYTGIFLRHRTLDIHTWYFPECLPLEHGPLRDNTITITYYDADNGSQAYDNSNYAVVQGYGKKPELLFIGEGSLPVTYNRYDAVTFSLNIGYDDDTIPEPIRQAILLTIADFYEYREDRGAILNTRAMTLLRPYKKWA